MSDRRRRLIQNYEEARLALLLDEYAELYGEASTKRYERDAAAGKVPPVSDRELEEKLTGILKRAEAEEAKKRRQAGAGRRLARKAATAAASIAVSFLVMVSVQAAGIDVFGAVGRWTDDLFYFEKDTRPGRGTPVSDAGNIAASDAENAPVFRIKETLAERGFPVELSPNWLPEGFSLLDTSFLENRDQASVFFYLENPEQRPMIIQFDKNVFSGAFGNEWFEKNSGDPEAVFVNGRMFYLFQNEEQWVGVHQSETHQIVISAEVERDEMLRIIRSIGETQK